ncbi:DUF6228 family protein [Saccharomonospora cyanea]|uniref:Uncharacterized protein n=1 Tax=Saccharomonospora cyanea NA-134 TaxID=882082 RepID=H5XJ71_9PSEU|nr:DUF6228 family protein [Saccharomonospora cyanea]EHR62881.1 hypothetical protein SaccyDRAFT_4060 [Saccharomonospora cyanea NA-134]
MTCAPAPEFDDCVVISPVGSSLAVSLWNSRESPAHETITAFCAQLTGPGSRAEAHEIWDMNAHGGEGFATFVAGLVKDFRGWQGVRTWRSFTEDLTVDAVHTTGGHVDLTWTLSNNVHVLDTRWSASVVITVDAGEELGRLAADLDEFLTPERT